MIIGFLMAGVFIFVTLVFIAIALLFPEWVGIQGKIAKKIESEHRPDLENDQNKNELP